MKEQIDIAVTYKKTAEAYHYGALSRFHTEKWQDWVDYCKEALKIEDNHKHCKELMKHSLNEIIKKQQENANKIKVDIYDDIKKYGIKIGKKLDFLPQDIGATPYIDNYNILHFPVILLYDEFMQSDFIQDFPTNSTFGEQLNVVLAQPAPWDPSHRYTLDNVDVFFETNMCEPLDSKEKIVEADKKYKKVDLSSNLLSVLQDETHVVPQYPIFTIVAKDFADYGKYIS